MLRSRVLHSIVATVAFLPCPCCIVHQFAKIKHSHSTAQGKMVSGYRTCVRQLCPHFSIAQSVCKSCTNCNMQLARQKVIQMTQPICHPGLNVHVLNHVKPPKRNILDRHWVFSGHVHVHRRRNRNTCVSIFGGVKKASKQMFLFRICPMNSQGITTYYPDF